MQKSFVFIFITVLIDVIGLGIIIPILPDLIMNLTNTDLATASKYSGWMAACYAVMLFVCAPIMGALSDQYGRRPILLISLFFFGLDYVLQGFAPSLSWLFVGRIIAGITGASFSTASAFISDLSTPDKKAQNFGIIGAAFGLGFIIGPMLGGILGNYGLRVPFFGSAILAGVNLIFGYFILPESLKKENRRVFDWRRANPIGTLQVLTKYSVLKSFLLILVLVYIAHYSLQSTWSFYTMYKFKWDHKMVGYSLAFVGLMMAIVQGGLTRIIIPRLGQNKSIYLGLVLASTGYLAYAFAPNGWSMYVIMIPFSISGISGPSIQGLIANQVPANGQGELQGGMTALMCLTSIIGPLIMTKLFNSCTEVNAFVFFPGAPFFMAFLLTGIALFLTVKLLSNPLNNN